MAVINTTCVDLSSEYGIRPVVSSSGAKLYFRREARGLNYDAISLTENDDYCSDRNPRTDYLFGKSGDTIYYKFEGDTLHLFVGTPAKVPPSYSRKIVVVQHKLR